MTTTLTTKCCIAGGGPAGLMLGLLLARADRCPVVPARPPGRVRPAAAGSRRRRFPARLIGMGVRPEHVETDAK